MPIFIEANYAKRIGLPDYSSHQFSVTLRTELGDLSQLEKTSAELYSRLQHEVDSQIVSAGYVPGQSARPLKSITQATSTDAPDSEDSWKCSARQRDLILKIMHTQGIDNEQIDKLARESFGTGVKQLNKPQASGLIDKLLRGGAA